MKKETGFHSPNAIKKRQEKKREVEIKIHRKEIDELKGRGEPFSRFPDEKLLEIIKECII
jgi:hypothetical protein